jgi:hypothetical protein
VDGHHRVSRRRACRPGRHGPLTSGLCPEISPEAGLISFGATLFASPIANAIPEKTIKSDCKSANGTYLSGSLNGHTYSSCTFKDIDGDTYTDTYVDGTYTGQDPYRVGGTAPVAQKPGSVPVLNVPLG